MITEKQLFYEDVVLVPRCSELVTRQHADTFEQATGTRIPVVPANMRCVISIPLARQLDKNGYFYIMHRFDIDIVNFVEIANKEKWNIVSVSLGVKSQDKEIVKRLHDAKLRVDYVTIDIAHGYSVLMKEMIAYCKEYLPSTSVIAGNVCTTPAIVELENWGADFIKVGIGNGASCITKDKTGFLSPMFSCVLECASVARVPIIADGGIRCNGDIAKALVAGASIVMAGGLFAQCVDSPAVTIDGEKQYYGSASQFNKNHTNNIEGKMLHIKQSPLTYLEKMEEIEQDLQSAISYGGGERLKDLRRVEWRTVK